jgi:hypothetical protein
MRDDRVFDFGPQPPARADPEALAQYKRDRAAWVKAYGDAPVEISIFSAGEAVERDPVRYAAVGSLED